MPSKDRKYFIFTIHYKTADGTGSVPVRAGTENEAREFFGYRKRFEHAQILSVDKTEATASKIGRAPKKVMEFYRYRIDYRLHGKRGSATIRARCLAVAAEAFSRRQKYMWAVIMSVTPLEEEKENPEEQPAG